MYVCVPNHYYHEAPSLKAPLNFFFFFPTSKRSWHQENELQKGVFSILHVGWLHETLWKWWWSPWGWPLFSLRDRRSLLDSLRRFLVLDRGAVTCENGTTKQCYQLLILISGQNVLQNASLVHFEIVNIALTCWGENID